MAANVSHRAELLEIFKTPRMEAADSSETSITLPVESVEIPYTSVTPLREPQNVVVSLTDQQVAGEV